MMSADLATVGVITRSTSGHILGRIGSKCGLKPQVFKPVLKAV
jgi:hypothetical protein